MGNKVFVAINLLLLLNVPSLLAMQNIDHMSSCFLSIEQTDNVSATYYYLNYKYKINWNYIYNYINQEATIYPRNSIMNFIAIELSI